MARDAPERRFPAVRRAWRAVGLAARGEKLPPWLQTFMTWPVSAWLVPVSAAVIGIWASLGSARITRDTHTFFARLSGDVQHVDPRWMTISFYVVLLTWSLVLFLRLTAARIEDRERVIELQGAIHRAPSRSVIDRYRFYFDSAAQVVQSLREEEHLDDPPNLEKIRAVLATLLESAATLARKFSRGDTGPATFSANFMLAAAPAELGADVIAKLEEGRRFCAPGELGSCSHVLWLPRTLSIDHDGEAHDVPLIALPVPHAVEEHGRRVALPGAPWAFLTGQASVFEDTSVLDTEWSDLEFITEFWQYFGRDGDAEHIGSFASFRIPASPKEPAVGVLSIDSTDTHVLGPGEEFYTTFYALVAPFVPLAQVPLGVYRDAIIRTNDPFRERVTIDEKVPAHVS